MANLYSSGLGGVTVSPEDRAYYELHGWPGGVDPYGQVYHPGTAQDPALGGNGTVPFGGYSGGFFGGVDKIMNVAYPIIMGAMLGGAGSAALGGAAAGAGAGTAGSGIGAAGGAEMGAGAAGAGATAGGAAGGAAAGGGGGVLDMFGSTAGAPGWTAGASEGGAAATGAGGAAAGSELGGLSDAELADILAGGDGSGTVLSGGTAAAGGAGMSGLGSYLANLSPAVIKALGSAGAAGLGLIGSRQQANALENIANQQRADRLPFLSKSLQYLNDPSAYFSGPVAQEAMKGTLRGLSVNGNPFGNPTSQEIATEAGLRNYQAALGGLANLGLSGQDTQAGLLSNAAASRAGGLNALGYGLGQITNPQPTLADLIKQMKGLGGGDSLA